MRRGVGRAVTALALCAGLAGCAASSYYEQARAWEARDPAAAAEYYRLCLLADPQHAEARARLTEFDFYGDLVAEAKRFDAGGDAEHALRDYDRIASIAGALREVGGPPPPVDLVALRGAACKAAAARRFEDGQRAQAAGDDAAATRAFRECLALDPTNQDANTAYHAAKTRATRRLGIVPFLPDEPGDARLGLAIADATTAAVSRHPPELIELVTRTHLDQLLDEHELDSMSLVDPKTAASSGKLMGLQLLVSGRLSVEKSDSGWSEQPGQQTKEVREAGKPPRQASAAWTVHTRTTRAALTCTVQVIDVETGAVLAADRVRKEKTAEARWARKTSGDDAALPPEVAALCKAGDAAPAAPDALVEELVPAVADAAGARIVETLR
jgi:hypothetical protein